MRNTPFLLLLCALVLSSCEKNELTSVSYLRDFSIDTVATDTIAAPMQLETSFYGYNNAAYYYGTTGANRFLRMLRPSQAWSREVRTTGGAKFIDGQVQFENILGNLVVLGASDGEAQENIAAAPGENLEYAFYYEGSVFNAFRESSRCVVGVREAAASTYTELVSVPDSGDPVQPQELQFFEGNNYAYAIWKCGGRAAGSDVFWVVKELTTPARIWTFRTEEPGEANKSFIRNQVFYYLKEQGTMEAFSLAGDSILWQSNDISGAPVAVNGAYVYMKKQNDLQVIDRRNGTTASTTSTPGEGYFYEDAFVLRSVPGELQILDRRNFQLLKAVPRKTELLSAVGNGRYLFQQAAPAGDTTFLHLLQIRPR